MSRAGRIAIVVCAIAAVVSIWSATRIPSDAIRHPRKIVATGGGACAFFDSGAPRCWGSTPLSAHGDDRPFAHPSALPAVDVAFFPGFAYPGAPPCLIDHLGVLECGAFSYTESRPPKYESIPHRYPLVRSAPEMRDLRSPLVDGVNVCVVASVDGVEGVWCHRRVLDGDPDVPTKWTHVFDSSSMSLGTKWLCAVQRAGGVGCLDFATGDVHIVEGVHEAVQVAVGDDFACACEKSGNVQCWGDDEVGQLGDGGNASHADARPVLLRARADHLVARDRHACALVEGKPLCWGQAQPLPDFAEARIDRVPTLAADIGGLKDLVLGSHFACGTRAREGTIWCWGRDGGGRLGNGTERPHLGCSREGYSGNSPEHEQEAGPTVVRSGEEGGYPRARLPAVLLATPLAFAPLVYAIHACGRALARRPHASRLARTTSYGAALVAAFSVQPLIMRLSVVLLSLRERLCRAGLPCSIHDSSLDAIVRGAIGSLGPLVATGVSVLVCLAIMQTLGDEAAERRSARRAAILLAVVAIPAMLVSMSVSHYIDADASIEIQYVLRDKRFELGPFLFVRWIWTIAWVVFAAAFAGHAALRGLERRTLQRAEG